MSYEEGKKAARISIWTLLSIGIAEIIVSTSTDSITLLADGIDSVADALISFIVWAGISMLQKPKSKLFPSGYGKVESFAAFIAAMVVIILGVFVALHAYERLVHPEEITNPIVTMITLLFAGLISLQRAFMIRKVARKYNLISLNLDARNSIKDGSSSFVGLVSILAGYFGIPYMDSIGGFVIASYIFFMAYTALKQSTLVLLDAVNNTNLNNQIIEYIKKNFNLSTEDINLRPLGHTVEA